MSGLSLFQVEEHLFLLLEAREEAAESFAALIADSSLGSEATVQAASQLCDEIDADIQRYIQAEVAKVDNIAGAIRHFSAMETQAKEESARLTARAAHAKAIVDRIKAGTMQVMEQMGKKSIPGKYNTLAIQGNGGVRPLVIRQSELVPLEQKRVTISLRAECARDFAEQFAGQYKVIEEIHPDTSAIRAALEAGESVAGAFLENRGSHLRVK